MACRAGWVVAVEPATGLADPGSIDAAGRLLIPGLHDPHMHLLSLARERQCVVLADELRGWCEIATLGTRCAADLPPGRWLQLRRFDPVMTGGCLPDRADLDAVDRVRPVRLRHRNLRLDVLNGEALRRSGLLEPPFPPGVEVDAAGRPTGRVFQNSALVRDEEDRPSAAELHELVAATSADLAAQGITSLQDAGAANGPTELALLDGLAACGAVRQRLWTMASAIALREGAVAEIDHRRVRHAKLEAIESRLDLEGLLAAAAAARRAGLPLAIHATTPVELAAAVAVLEAEPPPAGSRDRIEHASVASAEVVGAVASIGAAVVANPGLVLEAGEQYRREIGEAELPNVHRLASWRRAGVTLALASDAPVTAAPALATLRAAVERRSRKGEEFVPVERLSVPEALEAMTAVPAELIGELALGRVVVGAAADLALLDGDLPGGAVALTAVSGEVVHDPAGLAG